MSLARNVATVGSATLISRLLGFARDIGIADLFGAGIRADGFFVAFQLANLIRRMLAEGALNAAVIPLYLRARDEGGERKAGAFAGRLIGTSVVVLTGTVAAGALAMPAIVLVLAPGFIWGGPRMVIAVELARLMLPYLALAGPFAVLMGVLNANHRFATAAFATAAFNAVMLAALATVFYLRGGDSDMSGRIVAAGVTAAGAAQLLLVGIAVWRAKERVTPLSVSFGRDTRRFLALAIPGLLASGIPQITVIAGVMVASASRSAVSWIYYANRLIELPLGIVGIAVGTVLVPAFAHAIRSGNKRELSHVESRGIELAIGLALPAAIALASLASPIVHVLFERGAFTAADSAATASALAAFALGLPGHVLVKTFSPVFFAREDTATPMKAALAGFAVAIAGSLALMPAFGHVGVAIAIALSGWASAALLGALVARRIGFSIDREARRRLPRIVLAAVAMGAAVEGAQRLLAPFLGAGVPSVLQMAVLAALIAFGLAVYVVLLQAMRVASPRQLLRSVGKF
ncbi:MAG TPA: murein biosynthesis integral membrane protein MurJ [Pseudolabrys sp.]|nr:murein biosynthesis integral membrane protein MurJ [Pseudolabrys sp.]